MNMSTLPSPVIKGIFLKSHIQAVEKALGPEGLKKLESAYGGSLKFNNSDEVPIRDEVRLIECALRLLAADIPEDKVPYEAGRLHFNNFSTTPLGKLILPFFRNNFKKVVLNTRHVAGHVFRGVTFSTRELSPTHIEVTMTNADYPIEHFTGFFQAWMEYSGIQGTVTTHVTAPGVFAYDIVWDMTS
ncbi:MAG TPA: DUF2378 family protein [Patescibacteria group bacterium]|nr:DUF2378 family protein [Patescibacteria group bacterium]